MGEVKHECEHGQLARVCNICAYESDISDLTAERDALAAEKADCEKFLKEGERLDECLERWRADALSVLELLAQERVKSEALAAEVAKLKSETADKILAVSAACDAAVKRLSAACGQMREAQHMMVERYTELVNCGDCGSWNPPPIEIVDATERIASALERIADALEGEK